MFTWCLRGEWTGGEDSGPGRGGTTIVCQLHACIWGSGDPTQDDQAPPCHCLTPLPHLEPKSKLSSRPCPSLCPQPASALDRQTFPAYPAPLLASQSPKATQPTRLGAHQTRWVHKGPGMGLGHGCLQELDRSPPPVAAATGGKAGVNGVGLQGIFLIPSMS